MSSLLLLTTPGFAAKDFISMLIAVASFGVQDVILLTFEQLLLHESDNLARIRSLQPVVSEYSMQF